MQQRTVAYAPNVVGVVKGRRRQHRVVLIDGHYDSHSASSSAPGADDNASGTSCVLECARVLARQQFDCTLQFAAFSAEELGLVGSNAYAAHFGATGDTLVAMINVDMIEARRTCSVWIGDNKGAKFWTMALTALQATRRPLLVQ